MISPFFINESKLIVINTLKEYFKATNEEIEQFTELVEQEGPENWTCGFGDELLPLFEEMRTLNTNQNGK